jgi:hypothetical protein
LWRRWEHDKADRIVNTVLGTAFCERLRSGFQMRGDMMYNIMIVIGVVMLMVAWEGWLWDRYDANGSKKIY